MCCKAVREFKKGMKMPEAVRPHTLPQMCLDDGNRILRGVMDVTLHDF